MEFLYQISDWVNTTSDGYNPAIAWGVKIVAALVVFFVGYLIAKLVSGLIGGGINRIPFIKDANADATSNKATIGYSIGQAIFYLLMLVVAAVALSVVGLTQVVEPVQNMWNELLTYLPNIVGAAAIGGFGLIFAGILRRFILSVLTAARVDELASPIDGERAQGLSSAISWIGYAIVAIPAVIAAVGALDIETISTPLTLMLNEILNAIPNIVVAGLLLTIAYFIASFVSKLLGQVLPQTGIDSYAEKLGLLEDKSEKGLTASKALSNLAAIAIMLFAAVEATKLLNFSVLSEFVTIVLDQGGQILFGTAIIAVGFIFANLVGKVLDAAGTGMSDLVAKIVKYVIMVFAAIVGIARMGLDPSDGQFVLNIAEYLVIAAAFAIGVGGAIAFGLGGKEWAGKKLESWMK